jgi:hypothetical protein
MKVNFVIQIQKDGKRHAYAESIENGNCIFHYLSKIKDIETAFIVPTMKKAREVADAWNETQKHNGTFLEYV